MTSPTPRRNEPAAAAGTCIDWDRALRAHERWLRTVVLARLHDRDGADEVMQEIALAAVRQAAPLHDAAKVAPWLYRLAVRQVLLYRRRLGRGRKLLAGFAERGAPQAEGAAEGDPLGWLLADERRRLVRRALEGLAPRDAEILLLKYTEAWSYRQIAEHLGVGHAAVEARLHRARQRLREQLALLETAGV